MKRFLSEKVVYLAWVTSLAATFGSLYFSEIEHFTPCILCWYQRIFFYPLAIIIAVGIIRKDKNLHTYVLPLSILGLFVAFYHVLLQNGIIPEAAAPCIVGVSCTVTYVSYFGFVTIPLLSLLGFLVITASMIFYGKRGNVHVK